jgi:hypothetical protein
MQTIDTVYAAYEDETGEVYYCPMEEGRAAAARAADLDDCVEASTAGRYAGNLNIAKGVAEAEASA